MTETVNNYDNVVGLTAEEKLAIDNFNTPDDAEPSPIIDEPIPPEVVPPTEPELDPAPKAHIPDQFTPRYEAPAYNADELTTLETDFSTKMEALGAKLDEGELDFKQFQTQQTKINTEYYNARSRLDMARVKAEMAQEQSAQTAAQKWQWEQDTFFADNSNFKTDPVLYGALDATVKALANDPANAGKNGLTILRDAAQRVNERFNIPAKQPPVEKTPARQTAELPKTLAMFPLPLKIQSRENSDTWTSWEG